MICEINRTMALSTTEFDKKAFLNRGAIFAYFDKIWLFWGLKQISGNPAPGPCLYGNDFFLRAAQPWWTYNHQMCVSKSDLKNFFAAHTLTPHWEPPLREIFERQFLWAQEKIENKELNKVVPYLFETSSFPPESSFIESCLAHGLKVQSGFLYGFWEKGRGMIGLTPEILFEQVSSCSFRTNAIAGTTTLENYIKAPESFTEDPKEIQEHLWVVESLQSSLAELAHVYLSERQVLTTPHLAHLYTPMTFQTHKPLDVTTLIAKIHPTAALGASPREQLWSAMETLDSWQERNMFGAPFGLRINNEKSLFLVAIRNLCWEGEEVRITAGGGQVAESRRETEWQEMANKRQSIKRIFGLQ